MEYRRRHFPIFRENLHGLIVVGSTRGFTEGSVPVFRHHLIPIYFFTACLSTCTWVDIARWRHFDALPPPVVSMRLPRQRTAAAVLAGFIPPLLYSRGCTPEASTFINRRLPPYAASVGGSCGKTCRHIHGRLPRSRRVRHQLVADRPPLSGSG